MISATLSMVQDDGGESAGRGNSEEYLHHQREACILAGIVIFPDNVQTGTAPKFENFSLLMCKDFMFYNGI